MHVLSATVFPFLIDHIYHANETQASKNAQLNILLLKARHETTQATTIQPIDPKLRVRTSSLTVATNRESYTNCSKLHARNSVQGKTNPDRRIVKHSSYFQATKFLRLKHKNFEESKMQIWKIYSQRSMQIWSKQKKSAVFIFCCQQSNLFINSNQSNMKQRGTK